MERPLRSDAATCRQRGQAAAIWRCFGTPPVADASVASPAVKTDRLSPLRGTIGAWTNEEVMARR
jgi:hypothetical protein